MGGEGRRGGVDTTCQILRKEEEKKEGMERRVRQAERRPPETPLSLSPLLHHSPSLPLSHRPESSMSMSDLAL